MRKVAILGLGLTLTAVTAEANFLSYVDENGTRHIVQSADSGQSDD